MRKYFSVIMVVILLSAMFVTSYGATDVQAGDVNVDGRITAADARQALRASAGLDKLDDISFIAADMNGDGKVTASDARKILRISAGLEKADAEAVPPDFYRMENLLRNTLGTEFDCRTADTAYVVNNLIHARMFIQTYTDYFSHDSYTEYTGKKKNDPLYKYVSGRYFKIPVENVKWICENIYQVEFDDNYISDTGESYCYDGYVYVSYAEIGEGPWDFYTRIGYYNLLDDGKYEIYVGCYESDDYGETFVLKYSLKLIAEWKQIDGKYDWVFHSVEHI